MRGLRKLRKLASNKKAVMAEKAERAGKK